MDFQILRRLPVCLLTVATINGAAFAGQGIGTAPVGVQPLLIRGASDNVVSLPMPRPAVFRGYVRSATSNTLTVSLASSSDAAQSPGWQPNRFVYDAAGGQRETYYLEILTGQLAGVSFKIVSNDEHSIQVETEGDDLTSYPQLGAVAADDCVQIRPYWRICDVFEVDGTPLLEPRLNRFSAKDEILIPVYSDATVGINKAPNLLVHYLAGAGWRAVGQGEVDYGDYILPQSGVFVVRRRNAEDLTLWNAGPASLVRSVTFVPGGNGVSANDTYVALTHPVPVTLDASGLSGSDLVESVIQPSNSDFEREDELLAFPDTPGFNAAPAAIYYYRLGVGWKQVGVPGTVGETITLEPGKGYIIRKKAANPGTDWIKQPD